MAQILFFEKPGCAGNARQRTALEAAGHTLERRNLLQEPWTAESLLPFLQHLPVPQWFNRAAPSVKNGEIVPEHLEPDHALALLIAEPLLIRRPLMLRIDGAQPTTSSARMVGFDAVEVARFLGMNPHDSMSDSLEGCAAQAADPIDSSKGSSD